MLHQGLSFLVNEVCHETKKATVRPTHVEYITAYLQLITLIPQDVIETLNTQIACHYGQIESKK